MSLKIECLTYFALILFICYPMIISFVLFLGAPRSEINLQGTNPPTTLHPTKMPTSSPVTYTIANIYLFSDGSLRNGALSSRVDTNQICEDISSANPTVEELCIDSPTHMFISYSGGVAPYSIYDFQHLYAFLSDSVVRNATNPNTIYGTWGEMFSGTPDIQLLDLALADVIGDGHVSYWTGSTDTGNVATGFNCADFTSSSSGAQGMIGILASQTSEFISGTTDTCDNLFAFVCGCIV